MFHIYPTLEVVPSKKLVYVMFQMLSVRILQRTVPKLIMFPPMLRMVIQILRVRHMKVLILKIEILVFMITTMVTVMVTVVTTITITMEIMM